MARDISIYYKYLDIFEDRSVVDALFLLKKLAVIDKVEVIDHGWFGGSTLVIEVTTNRRQSLASEYDSSKASIK